MKVFLSWSGELSRSVAEALREWIPNVLQAVDPWISSEDIDKGARWSSDIAGELNKTKFGIICVTPDNLEAPWLNFEAGALSKTLDKTFVCPYLFGLKPSDLRGPLVQFQACLSQKEDTRRLIGTLNAALEKEGLSDRQLDKTFEVWWPELEKQLDKLGSTKAAPKARRSEREILEEILALVRSQGRYLAMEVTPIDPLKRADVPVSTLRPRWIVPEKILYEDELRTADPVRYEVLQILKKNKELREALEESEEKKPTSQKRRDPKK
jgi:hypothetical protein